MIEEEEVKINLRQYKGHTRKFPWALLVRIVVALISIGIIVYISQILSEKQQQNSTENFEIEIEN